MPVMPPPRREDDLVGEAVGDLAGGVFAGIFAVLLGEHLRVLRVLGVEEEAVDGEAIAGDAEGAEGDHVGERRSGGPLVELDLGGGAGRDRGGHGLRDHVEDAGVREVGEEDGVEGAAERFGLRAESARLEVGGGDAGAAAGIALQFDGDVVLREQGRREESRRAWQRQGSRPQASKTGAHSASKASPLLW